MIRHLATRQRRTPRRVTHSLITIPELYYCRHDFTGLFASSAVFHAPKKPKIKAGGEALDKKRNDEEVADKKLVKPKEKSNGKKGKSPVKSELQFEEYLSPYELLHRIQLQIKLGLIKSSGVPQGVSFAVAQDLNDFSLSLSREDVGVAIPLPSFKLIPTLLMKSDVSYTPLFTSTYSITTTQEADSFAETALYRMKRHFHEKRESSATVSEVGVGIAARQPFGGGPKKISTDVNIPVESANLTNDNDINHCYDSDDAIAPHYQSLGSFVSFNLKVKGNSKESITDNSNTSDVQRPSLLVGDVHEIIKSSNNTKKGDAQKKKEYENDEDNMIGFTAADPAAVTDSRILAASLSSASSTAVSPQNVFADMRYVSNLFYFKKETTQVIQNRKQSVLYKQIRAIRNKIGNGMVSIRMTPIMVNPNVVVDVSELSSNPTTAMANKSVSDDSNTKRKPIILSRTKSGTQNSAGPTTPLHHDPLAHPLESPYDNAEAYLVTVELLPDDVISNYNPAAVLRNTIDFPKVDIPAIEYIKLRGIEMSSNQRLFSKRSTKEDGPLGVLFEILRALLDGFQITSKPALKGVVDNEANESDCLTFKASLNSSDIGTIDTEALASILGSEDEYSPDYFVDEQALKRRIESNAMNHIPRNLVECVVRHYLGTFITIESDFLVSKCMFQSKLKIDLCGHEGSSESWFPSNHRRKVSTGDFMTESEQRDKRVDDVSFMPHVKEENFPFDTFPPILLGFGFGNSKKLAGEAACYQMLKRNFKIEISRSVVGHKWTPKNLFSKEGDKSELIDGNTNYTVKDGFMAEYFEKLKVSPSVGQLNAGLLVSNSDALDKGESSTDLGHFPNPPSSISSLPIEEQAIRRLQVVIHRLHPGVGFVIHSVAEEVHENNNEQSEIFVKRNCEDEDDMPGEEEVVVKPRIVERGDRKRHNNSSIDVGGGVKLRLEDEGGMSHNCLQPKMPIREPEELLIKNKGVPTTMWVSQVILNNEERTFIGIGSCKRSRIESKHLAALDALSRLAPELALPLRTLASNTVTPPSTGGAIDTEDIKLQQKHDFDYDKSGVNNNEEIFGENGIEANIEDRLFEAGDVVAEEYIPDGKGDGSEPWRISSSASHLDVGMEALSDSSSKGSYNKAFPTPHSPRKFTPAYSMLSLYRRAIQMQIVATVDHALEEKEKDITSKLEDGHENQTMNKLAAAVQAYKSTEDFDALEWEVREVMTERSSSILDAYSDEYDGEAHLNSPSGHQSDAFCVLYVVPVDTYRHGSGGKTLSIADFPETREEQEKTNMPPFFRLSPLPSEIDSMPKVRRSKSALSYAAPVSISLARLKAYTACFHANIPVDSDIFSDTYERLGEAPPPCSLRDPTISGVASSIMHYLGCRISVIKQTGTSGVTVASVLGLPSQQGEQPFPLSICSLRCPNAAQKKALLGALMVVIEAGTPDDETTTDVQLDSSDKKGDRTSNNYLPPPMALKIPIGDSSVNEVNGYLSKALTFLKLEEESILNVHFQQKHSVSKTCKLAKEAEVPSKREEDVIDQVSREALYANLHEFKDIPRDVYITISGLADTERLKFLWSDAVYSVGGTAATVARPFIPRRKMDSTSTEANSNAGMMLEKNIDPKVVYLHQQTKRSSELLRSAIFSMDSGVTEMGKSEIMANLSSAVNPRTPLRITLHHRRDSDSESEQHSGSNSLHSLEFVDVQGVGIREALDRLVDLWAQHRANRLYGILDASPNSEESSGRAIDFLAVFRTKLKQLRDSMSHLPTASLSHAADGSFTTPMSDSTSSVAPVTTTATILSPALVRHRQLPVKIHFERLVEQYLGCPVDILFYRSPIALSSGGKSHLNVDGANVSAPIPSFSDKTTVIQPLVSPSQPSPGLGGCAENRSWYCVIGLKLMVDSGNTVLVAVPNSPLLSSSKPSAHEDITYAPLHTLPSTQSLAAASKVLYSNTDVGESLVRKDNGSTTANVDNMMPLGIGAAGSKKEALSAAVTHAMQWHFPEQLAELNRANIFA